MRFNYLSILREKHSHDFIVYLFARISFWMIQGNGALELPWLLFIGVFRVNIINICTLYIVQVHIHCTQRQTHISLCFVHFTYYKLSVTVTLSLSVGWCLLLLLSQFKFSVVNFFCLWKPRDSAIFHITKYKKNRSADKTIIIISMYN